jgi:hypothetical protein
MEPWDVYEKIKTNHFGNYDINAIDTMSFDEDDERFRDFISLRDMQNQHTIDYSNGIIENYNRLILETNTQYGIWEEFLKRLSLIRQVVRSKTDEMFTCAN